MTKDIGIKITLYCTQKVSVNRLAAGTYALSVSDVTDDHRGNAPSIEKGGTVCSSVY